MLILEIKNSFEDDISLYQNYFEDAFVHVIANEEPNPKLTYHQDFINLKHQLEGELDMRIGHSFDIHQLKRR